MRIGPDVYRCIGEQDFQQFITPEVKGLETCSIAKETACKANGGGAVYPGQYMYSFDVAYAPGMGNSEPDGLVFRLGLVIRRLSKSFEPGSFAMDLVKASTYADSRSYNGGTTLCLDQRCDITAGNPGPDQERS